MSALKTIGLSIGYNSNSGSRVLIAPKLNLELRMGQVTALLGANGAGKSTLLRVLGGLQSPISGKVLVMDTDISTLAKHRLACLIGMVSTDRIQAGGLTVRELVALGRQPHTGFFGRLDSNDRQVVEQAIGLVGIGHKASSFVAQLSDGERQKAMIAKALAQETPIIMLDEPTSFLDAASRIEMLALLHSLAAKQGKAILLTTHDVAQTLPYVDNLWVACNDGTIECGNTEDLVLTKVLERVFPNKGISFNYASGDYMAMSAPSHSVALHCSDATCLAWVTSALRRTGIAISEEAPISIVCNYPSFTITGADGTHSKVDGVGSMLAELQFRFIM